MPRLLPLTLSIFLLTSLLAGCETGSEATISGPQAPDGDRTVTITMRNLGTSAWVVSDIEPDTDATTTGVENPAFVLTEGERYRINNEGGSAHPLAIRSENGDNLLRQDTAGGSLADQRDIDFVADDTGITFTFTRSLAQEVDSYHCTNHADMTGSVTAGE